MIPLIFFRKNAEKVSRQFNDRPNTAMDTAAFWIEYVARHEKGTLKAPVVDMPWWQSSLLDVYAFILSVLVLILIIIYYLLKITIKKMSSKFLNLPNNKNLRTKKHR